MTQPLQRSPRGWKPTVGMIEEARRNAGGWVYEIEGEFGPDDRIPGSAVRRAWEVDRGGKLTGRYAENPRFRSGDRS